MGATRAVEPYPIRMFAECGADFALWGVLDVDPPGAVSDDPDESLEHQLPITADLRDRLLSWADWHFRYDGGDRAINMDDFDNVGMMLSRELMRELGPQYTVTYHFTFAGSRERFLPLVEHEPLDGWAPNRV
ncbi:MAG: hypothetical protein JWP74_2076 [Marmoricola sp.]|nr:hypothetical protein [Marmoricola sp.]